MFSRTDQSQIQLLQKLKVDFPCDSTFIRSYVFPLMQTRAIPDASIDELMICVLDAFHALKHENKEIVDEIKNLPFVRVNLSSGNRKCPTELFDPRDDLITQIFRREQKFPISPYDKDEHLDVLKQCGLQTVLKPEEILAVIRSCGAAPSSHPKHVDRTTFTRITAVISYMCRKDFLRQLSDSLGDFSQELNDLTFAKSWIPVLETPPSMLDYPSELEWKGRGYDCHLMSFQAKPYHILSTAADSTNTPLLIGSQVYMSHPPLVPHIASMLPACNSGTTTQHVIAHLREIVMCKDKIAQESIANLLPHIYSYLMNADDRSLLNSISECLYIRKRHLFVKPSVVAIEQDQTFRHDLEPYIYLLPEALYKYKQLFFLFGMRECINRSQIVSVLKKIKEEIALDALSIGSSQAADLIMSILNWLTNNGSKDVSEFVQHEEVYIPVDSDSKDPQLENARDVVFSDSNFLKEFAQSESESALLFSHSSIHQRMAECLGLTLLSEEMDISEDAFEDTGQHEPLTERLKTILKDYKDGLIIIKELLQNADDAEASEFNICFDNRHHSVKKERMLFQGMIEAHGPALVVHNNRAFSDEDFVNITKLAGATKEKKQLKIGKFGIGFCSVYHITDVPSFVSRDLLHIFDPTLSCLRKEVRNPSKPGKKIKFTEKLISRSEQLKPYIGLFGFSKSEQYSGTMFRLPFRTGASELSTKCYDEKLSMN